jgi:hypothetical protein
MTALAQPIFWTPQTDPSVILLGPAPAPTDSRQVTADDLRSRAIFQVQAMAARLEMRGERFDIGFANPTHHGPLAATVLLDDHTPDRLTALARFWAGSMGRRVPVDRRITAQRRRRALQMLRAVDARQAGATYRLIAQYLFPKDMTDPGSWDGSAIRETTIRLTRDGLKLVRGGYRLLLHRPRRNR